MSNNTIAFNDPDKLNSAMRVARLRIAAVAGLAVASQCRVRTPDPTEPTRINGKLAKPWNRAYGPVRERPGLRAPVNKARIRAERKRQRQAKKQGRK